MTFLFFIVSSVISATFKYDYKFGDHHDVTLDNDYNRALFTLPAGKGFMMVEWGDAILSISVPGISQKHARLTKHSGFSVFLFNQDASIDIMFYQKITFSVFTCPYIESTDGAKQFISNYAINEIGIQTGRDVYFKVFDKFEMSGSLEKTGLGGEVVLHYFQDGIEKSTKSIKSINLANLNNHAAIEVIGIFAEAKGKLYLNCKPEFNPTVPTLVELILMVK